MSERADLSAERRTSAMPDKRMLLLTGVSLSLLIFFVCLLLYPRAALEAALRGFAIWWDVLFPALFPFLVISEMMLGVGIVHFLGTLFDPFMRPVFRVPGIGGFVFAMGFAAGYPVGSKLATQLNEQQLISRTEAERLTAFTSTSDPIFLIGAVSIGFFRDPALAWVLAAAHYGTAIAIGVLMRFYRGDDRRDLPLMRWEFRSSVFVRAFQAMHEARLKDGRNLGVLLQDAVTSSIQLIMVIGGLMVFFSVLLEMMIQIGWLQALTSVISGVLAIAGIPLALTEAIANGIFEVTLGARTAGSLADSIGLKPSAAVTAFILSWSGLSVHAQIVSIMSRARIRYAPFLLARIVHGVLAFLTVMVGWDVLYPAAERAWGAVLAYAGDLPARLGAVWLWPLTAAVFAAIMTILAFGSAAAVLLRRLLRK
jgi:sporulation integral membrane protein YlbJ